MSDAIERLRELTRSGDADAAQALYLEATRRGDTDDLDRAARTLLSSGRWQLEIGQATLRPVPAPPIAQRTVASARAAAIACAPALLSVQAALDALVDTGTDARARCLAALAPLRDQLDAGLGAICLDGASAWTVRLGRCAIVRLRLPETVEWLAADFDAEPAVERHAFEPGDTLLAVGAALVEHGEAALRDVFLRRTRARFESACEILLGQLSGVREPVGIAGLRLRRGAP